MPVLGPAGLTQFTIGDLANEVILKVENRTNDINRAYVWIRDALLDIAGNVDYRDEFKELEVLGPIFNLTGGQVGTSVQEYTETNIIPTGNINDATLDIMLWIDFPTNTIRRKLSPTHFQDADKVQSNSTSLPTEWYRFGANIGFVPAPDKNYQVQARILMMHPINDANLASTAVLLPRDWHLVLVYTAAKIGFAELLEFEKAQALSVEIHGDSKDPTKPGLIKTRKRTREREAWRVEQALRPVIRGYGWGLRR